MQLTANYSYYNSIAVAFHLYSTCMYRDFCQPMRFTNEGRPAAAFTFVPSHCHIVMLYKENSSVSIAHTGELLVTHHFSIPLLHSILLTFGPLDCFYNKFITYHHNQISLTLFYQTIFLIMNLQEIYMYNIILQHQRHCTISLLLSYDEIIQSLYSTCIQPGIKIPNSDSTLRLTSLLSTVDPLTMVKSKLHFKLCHAPV